MRIVRDWVICGPFPHGVLLSDGFESFYIDYLESLGGESKAVLRPGLKIGEAQCVEYRADERGFVDLVKVYGEVFERFWRLRYGVAYAYTELEVEESGTYVFLVGSEDYVTIYVNGEHVFTSHIAKRYLDSYYAVPVELVKGGNRVLLKIGRLAGRWGFSLKVDSAVAPIYVNSARNILPEPPRGSRVAEWIGIHVLALKDVVFKVRCIEDDMWYSCESETITLKRGERTQIPLFIMSKKPLETPTKLQLVFDVEGYGRVQHELTITPSTSELHRVHTYRSRYDGSVHRYGVKVPVKYDPNRDYPAVIILHGFKGIPMYTQVFGDKDWCISIAPTARDGEVNYREIGLLEVFEVLEDVKKRYRVSEDRVHLMGHSMGGYGTWYIGVKRPHVFATLSPHASRGDLTSTVKALMKYPGWEGVAKLVDKYNPAKYVENLIATPVYIAHGSADEIVPVEYSRSMAKLLDFLGYSYVYEEIKGRPHWWGTYSPGSYYGAEAIDRPSLDEFLKRSTRGFPRRVVAVVDDTRFNRYWWVIIRRLTYRELGYVDIEVLNTSEIRINAVRGVRSLSLDFEELCRRGIVDCKSFVKVHYRGQTITIPPHLLSNELELLLSDDGELCARHGELLLCSTTGIRQYVEVESVGPSKNVLSGPFMDVFNGRVAIVSCSDHRLSEACYKVALHLQYWWLDYANGVAKIVSDLEAITHNVHQVSNIVAIGGPEVNKYVEKAIDHIKPIKMLGECIEVKGRRYCGEQFGVAFIYPNPLVEFKRYIGVLGSNSLRAILASTRLDYTLIPDYLVYDANSVGTKLDGVVASGFFDEKWS
jgi:esterase/lipase